MRLVHQTFLMLAAVVLIAVGSMAALFALTLERGFVAYVNARQLEQFELFHRLLNAEAARLGTLEPIKRNDFMWRRLMRLAEGAGGDAGPDDNAARDGAGPPFGRPRYGRGPGAAADAGADGLPREFRNGKGPPRAGGIQRPPREGPPPPRADPPPPREEPPSSPEEPPPPRGEAAGAPDNPPPRPPVPRGGPPDANPFGLGQNVALLDADRRPVYMRQHLRARESAPVERAVTVNGKTEGWVQLWPVERIDRPEDVAFLRSQYTRLAWGTGALVLLMLGVAPLVGRRITRPLRSVTEATGRIAHGDLDVRLPTTRRDEIGTLMQNVNGMAVSLQALEQTRKRWIAEIAHELRTPLTVLQAELEALAVGVRPLDAAAIASLQDETRQLTRLVGDLHQLALADLDALPCTMGPIDLAELARRVAERFRTHAEQKGLQLEVAVPAQPVKLEADAQRIDQLLGNLVQNSIRYTDAPGRIAVRVERRNTTATLTVEDSPPGVAPDDYERLFDPLYRADVARSRKSGGSGLGLAICRAIVHAHGGTIAASRSTLGGLRLSATLPLLPPASS